jgi:putative transposase
MFIDPFHLVLSALAHWANREQAAIIDYLCGENRVLRDRLGPRRLRFTDAERRRLAAKAKLVCRSVLREIGSLVTPDTLLRCCAGTGS